MISLKKAYYKFIYLHIYVYIYIYIYIPLVFTECPLAAGNAATGTRERLVAASRHHAGLAADTSVMSP